MAVKRSSTKQEHSSKLVRININVPEQLRNSFKAKVSSKGLKIQDVLSRYIKEYVEKN